MFYLPMVALLLVGAFYLVFARVVCDPLYADDAESAGYKSGPTMDALRPFLSPDFKRDETMPAPRWNFGRSCQMATTRR